MKWINASTPLMMIQKLSFIALLPFTKTKYEQMQDIPRFYVVKSCVNNQINLQFWTNETIPMAVIIFYKKYPWNSFERMVSLYEFDWKNTWLIQDFWMA